MIFDEIKNLARYRGLQSSFDKVLAYLAEHDLASYELGKYEIDGKQALLFIQDNQLNQESSKQYEFHEKYADLHFLLAGSEKLNYGQLVEEVVQAYDTETDIGFVTCKEACPLLLREGNFVLFLPGEAHQPSLYGGGKQRVKKCLVKISWSD
ncbi:YhcH/YjgK/YiaL family protein [Streptococcus oricebi]|uniref:Beta-galactosidase n=1 Tax=Streptococcus oricebi TaxID=1547447 RepID=A0ABS5B5V0_9STRE|nr:YhcH/YjgK/YiaL family protein [Streptococcus oricebi]MBP2624219.1 beta-galactosidase [Streptococcus oricebi]